MQQGRVALMSYHTQWSCGHEWEGKRGRFPVPAAIVPPLGAYISRSWGGHIFYRCWFIWSTSTVIIRLYIYIFIFILSFIVGVFARLMHWNGLWAQEPRTCSEVKNLHFSFFLKNQIIFSYLMARWPSQKPPMSITTTSLPGNFRIILKRVLKPPTTCGLSSVFRLWFRHGPGVILVLPG